MDEYDKRLLIERYLDAYNAFDVDGMMSVLHPDIAEEGGRSQLRKLMR